MQPSSRAIATHKAAGFILETVADIKSESMAGFSSESLAEIARNQQSKDRRMASVPASGVKTSGKEPAAIAATVAAELLAAFEREGDQQR